MPTYKELQKEAKELGLKSVGISKVNLEKDIKKFKEFKDEVDMSAIEDMELLQKEENELNEEEYNAAVVLNKHGNEVRRYVPEVHGANFAELAAQLVNKKADEDFSLVLKLVKPSISCPHCGGTINRD